MISNPKIDARKRTVTVACRHDRVGYSLTRVAREELSIPPSIGEFIPTRTRKLRSPDFQPAMRGRFAVSIFGAPGMQEPREGNNVADKSALYETEFELGQDMYIIPCSGFLPDWYCCLSLAC